MQKTTSKTHFTIDTTENLTVQDNKIPANYRLQGIDYKIMVEPKDRQYICSSSPHIMQKIIQCEEGHLSCYQCTEITTQSSANEPIKGICYACNKPSQSSESNPTTFFEDKYIERMINSIEIACPVKATFNIEKSDQDCSWSGNLKSLKSHLITRCKLFPKNEIIDQKLSDIENKIEKLALDIEKNKNEVVKYSEHNKLKEQVATLSTKLESLEQLCCSILDNVESLNKQISNHTSNITQTSIIPSNGEMVWKIDNFSQRMADAKNNISISCLSSYFYSKEFGYKLGIKIYLNGDGTGKNTHLSVFLFIESGEYDDILKWPFNKNITFILINQQRERDHIDSFFPDITSNSFQQPKSKRRNIATGCPEFIAHNKLMANGYIINNAIFLKVILN
jgi:hypothetical protein